MKFSLRFSRSWLFITDVTRESTLHSVGGLISYTRQHVRVSVHSLGDGGVPQELLHQLGMNPPVQQQGRRRVPEIMEADLRKISVLPQRLERAVYDV